jgi:hypothetical protein
MHIGEEVRGEEPILGKLKNICSMVYWLENNQKRNRVLENLPKYFLSRKWGRRLGTTKLAALNIYHSCSFSSSKGRLCSSSCVISSLLLGSGLS